MQIPPHQCHHWHFRSLRIPLNFPLYQRCCLAGLQHMPLDRNRSGNIWLCFGRPIIFSHGGQGKIRENGYSYGAHMAIRMLQHRYQSGTSWLWYIDAYIDPTPPAKHLASSFTSRSALSIARSPPFAVSFFWQPFPRGHAIRWDTHTPMNVLRGRANQYFLYRRGSDWISWPSVSDIHAK
jgi:hypothetical protein